MTGMCARKAKTVIRVVKNRARAYRVRGIETVFDAKTGEEREREWREYTTPAEYAVLKEDECQALILKAGDGWRVCVPTPSSRIGRAVSPVGLNRFGAVKRWALKFFEQPRSA